MKSIAFACLALFAASALAQPVYKWTDAQGVVHYGDRPPADAATEEVPIEPPTPEAAAWEPAAANTSATAPGDPAAQQAATPQPLDIVMYARSDCGYCAKARKYFAQRGIGYRELDVERYAQAKAEWKRLGGIGVPLFVINGKVHRGFSASGMDQWLSRYGW